MASDEVRLVISTISDGRARDIRFRQNQFQSLHRWISSHTDQVEAAIQNDDGVSIIQAKYVVALTLKDLKSSYEKLDLQQALWAEYSVKYGRDNENRSVPEDLVYIISETYMTFYSVMSALFACITAGSCCLIELPDRSTQSVAMAHLCLVESLDRSAFSVVNIRPSSTVLERCLVIDQLGSFKAGIGQRVIRSQPQLWTAAIVDRGADLELAARYIQASKMFGKSPYAPNCILVNEFVAEALYQPTWQASFKISRLSSRADLKPHSSKPASTIHLLSTASHEDAIDAIEGHHTEPLLALYVFAAPAAAKYLTQFIRSDVSFVNNIPANLLIGPAAPRNYKLSPNMRYSKSMMQIPSPTFVSLPKNEPDVHQLSSNSFKVVEAMHCRFMKPLPPTGQPKDGDSNFFAQGLVTGIVVLALPLLAGTIGAITYGAWKAYRYLKRA